MTGMIITIDAEALARDNWKRIPRRYRIIGWFFPRLKEQAIQQAARKLSGEGEAS